MTSLIRKVLICVKKTVSRGTSLDWIAIVISLGSLLVTVYWSNQQYELAREHNKKSVKPILNFYIFNSENSGYKIQNVGLGPAIIHGVKVTDKNSNNSFDSWETLVRDKLNYKGAYFCSDTMKGSAHQNGIERKLLTINERLMITKSSGIKFEVCYCSIYDECWISGIEQSPYEVGSCENFKYNISC